MGHKFKYSWNLKDASFSKDKGKVFSCFACGGGSTMGYKLAGYDVLGCNEIDKRMLSIYEANHHPKFAFLGPIQEFKNREDLPAELYNLDVLDGSPPCSTFSIAGSREEAWGVEKKFREGQAEQVLDTLFFDFIDLAKRLQPKVVIAENVKGLLQGNAKAYVDRIYREFDEAGYSCQHVLLNGQDMGVPQRRERVFFLCLRKDLVEKVPATYNLFDAIPTIDMTFSEEPIPFSEIKTEGMDKPLTPRAADLWALKEEGDIGLEKCSARSGGNPNGFFSSKFVYSHRACNTICAGDSLVLFDEPRGLNNAEIISASTFPQDYDFGKEKPAYVCGMSVPPVMMAQIASRVYEQWLSKINAPE
ncbi:MAG: DNA (cytosine-5-)-methyltransferase [Clostridium sp.]|nr:DNA (cytosine-5-)-methyltransferase [Clostridium sp.]